MWWYRRSKLNVKTYVHEFLYIGKMFCQKCFQYQSINLKCMLCVWVWGVVQMRVHNNLHVSTSLPVQGCSNQGDTAHRSVPVPRKIPRERERKKKREGRRGWRKVRGRGEGGGWRGNEYYIWFFHHPWLTSAVICMSRVAATGAMACAENHNKDDVKYIL